MKTVAVGFNIPRHVAVLERHQRVLKIKEEEENEKRNLWLITQKKSIIKDTYKNDIDPLFQKNTNQYLNLLVK